MFFINTQNIDLTCTKIAWKPLKKPFFLFLHVYIRNIDVFLIFYFTVYLKLGTVFLLKWEHNSADFVVHK